MKDSYDLSKFKAQSKPRKNSRTKGNTFERNIATMLNERFGTKEFCRTPGSGAFATTHNLPKHLKVYGDLITPENFKFVLECKKGYNKENLCGFFRKNSKIRAFIRQAEAESKFSKKPFLIVFKQDSLNTVAILKTSSIIEQPPLSCSITYKEYTICLFDELLQGPDSNFLD